MSFRCTLIVLAVLLTAGCAGDACADRSVIVVVRHADRDGELLNEKGKQRARDLRDLVAAEYGPATVVIHTTFERTRQTLEPIIEASQPAELEFEPDAYPAIAGAARQGDESKVVVVAGHSNSVRPILEQFDKAQVDQAAADWFPCEGEICHYDYDDVWTVTLCGDSQVTISKANYGAPTLED